MNGYYYYDGSYYYINCDEYELETIPAGHEFDKNEEDYYSCYEDITITKNCLNCDYSETVTIPTHGHDFETLYNHWDATCDSRGYDYGYCSHCGWFSGYTNPLGHDYVVVDQVSATCEKDGYIEYQCTRCNDTYREVLYKYGHDMTTTYADDFDCMSGGDVTYTCNRCQKQITMNIKSMGHDYLTETVPATCTQTGSVTLTCKVCGYTKTDTLPKANHNYWTTDYKAPTCEESGYATYVCSACDATYTETLEPTGHFYTTPTDMKDPTCFEDGYVKYICRNGDCTNVYTEIVPTRGHSFYVESVIKEPTCEETGYVTLRCRYCNMDKTIEVPAYDHLYEITDYQDATCEEDGYITYVCSRGDAEYTETIEATGHEYLVIDHEDATCEEDGYTSYICSACDAAYTETIEASGHDVVVDAACEAACIKEGMTEGSHCATCGKVITAQEVIPATGHNYKKTAEQLSCEGEGSVTYTCEDCGNVMELEMPALGHNYIIESMSGNCEDLTINYRCERCGGEKTVHTSIEHTAEGAVVENAVAAQAFTYGSYDEVVYCALCDEELSRDTYEVLPLNYGNGDLDESEEVNVLDGQKVLAYINNQIVLTPEEIMMADVDYDGDVDYEDVQIILDRSVGNVAE